MTLEYFNKLEDLIDENADDSQFIALYKKYFNREPDDNLILNYNTNVNNKQYYLDNQSDDDSYDDSYNDDEPYGDQDD